MITSEQASAAFNELPPETRQMLSIQHSYLAIQYLNFEKGRLIARHAQSLREINEHIHNHEEHIRRG